MPKLETYSKRVLEPLCKATKTLLEPLKLMPNDFLLVGVDKEAKKFVLKIAVLKEPKDDNDERLVTCPDGIERVLDTWHASHPARIEFMNRIPERKEIEPLNRLDKWIVAATDFTVLVIHHSWPKEKIVFGEQAKILYNYILMRFLAQSYSANLVARFKAEQYVPPMPDDFIEHPNPNLVLLDYQKIALLASLNQPGYALFMEQGTGKTPVIVNRVNLEGSRKRKNSNKMYKALIVCPKHLRKNWAKEFERFSVSPGKTVVLRGGQEARIRCLNDGTMDESDCDWSACMVSWDSVPSMWDYIKLVNWDLVTYDESHKAKNPSSRRFKFLRKFSQFNHIKQRTDLTGTPIANSVMDLWAQWELLGEGLSGFMSFKNFRSYHGKFKKIELADGGSIDRLIGLKNIPLVQERLSRISFLITRKEAKLKLPSKVYDYAEVSM
ncbi:MAG: SNF2-related protein, partial [Nitrosopumilus sp.]